eukprot:2708347-Prymnesium_polylepis.1
MNAEPRPAPPQQNHSPGRTSPLTRVNKAVQRYGVCGGWWQIVSQCCWVSLFGPRPAPPGITPSQTALCCRRVVPLARASRHAPQC